MYREIFASVSFSPSLSAGYFKIGRIPMSQIISFKHNGVWANQNWMKLFASVGGEKLHGAKITSYAVYILSILTSKEFKVPK